MTATSGLLYVASKLTIPARISVEEYDTWYNDIHIPHILETSEIDSAYRYYATTTPDSTPEWSFLAVYPVASINFFETEEFNNIPLTSATLPGPSHSCLDIAEFDNRRYRELGKWEDKEMPASPMSHLLVLEFDLPFDILGSDDQTVLDWYNKIFSGSDQRFRVYKAIWAARYQTEQFEDLPAFLALHEFMDDKDVPHEITRVIQCGVKVNQWRLHASFETSSGAPRFFNLTRKY